VALRVTYRSNSHFIFFRILQN